MRLPLSLCLVLLAFAAPALAQGKKPQDPENTLILELKSGKVTIEMRPDLAPQHVERVKRLTREEFYNGIVFHRVIPGFMAQTGDPTGTGSGGSKYPDLPAEFTPTAFERGTIGAARANEPNTANSQFFICFTHAPNLNRLYTVWGRVVDGMPHVDQVAKGEPPPTPDKIVRMYVLADGPPAGAATPAKAPAAKTPAKTPAAKAPAGETPAETLPWAKK